MLHTRTMCPQTNTAGTRNSVERQPRSSAALTQRAPRQQGRRLSHGDNHLPRWRGRTNRKLHAHCGGWRGARAEAVAVIWQKKLGQQRGRKGGRAQGKVAGLLSRPASLAAQPWAACAAFVLLAPRRATPGAAIRARPKIPHTGYCYCFVLFCPCSVFCT